MYLGFLFFSFFPPVFFDSLPPFFEIGSPIFQPWPSLLSCWEWPSTSDLLATFSQVLKFQNQKPHDLCNIGDQILELHARQATGCLNYCMHIPGLHKHFKCNFSIPSYFLLCSELFVDLTVVAAHTWMWTYGDQRICIDWYLKTGITDAVSHIMSLLQFGDTFFQNTLKWPWFSIENKNLWSL